MNPSVREAREGRVALAHLLAGIDLPDAGTITQLRARRAAEARWEAKAS